MEANAYQSNRNCRVFNREREFFVPFRIGTLPHHPCLQFLWIVEKTITILRAHVWEKRTDKFIGGTNSKQGKQINPNSCGRPGGDRF